MSTNCTGDLVCHFAHYSIMLVTVSPGLFANNYIHLLVEFHNFYSR